MRFEFEDKHENKQCIKFIYPATENFVLFQEKQVLKCHPNAHTGIFSYVLNKLPGKDP